MEAKNHTGTRVSPCTWGTGFSFVAISRKTAILIVTAILLIILLFTQSGKAAKLEKGAEVAFARAEQLLHEADKENRNVRPLPLSLVRV
jgi:hypothetical protein